MFDRAGLLAIALVTASLAGCTGLMGSDVDELRQTAEGASEQLGKPRAALEAGFEPAAFCLPGEGVHWIKEERVDDQLDASDPEALLFQPTTERVESTIADEQRFLGVAYLAEMPEDGQPPSLAGVSLDGPRSDLPASLGPVAELHVFLADDIVDGPRDVFADRTDGVDCPEGTTPPTSYEHTASQADPSSCEDVLTGERTHEHARVEIYLGSERPYDFSPERYQLADRSIHFEAGQRDAGGAIAHVHEDGATLGCLLETLGWDVEGDRLVTDTGEIHEATPEQPFEVFVDGERSAKGLDQPLEHERTYVLRHDSSAAPEPCPNVGGSQVHEHAHLEVRLNGSEPWDFSPDRYQHQAPFVAFENGDEDADGAQIHAHEARPTLGCLFATLGWETAEHRIETDTGEVYEAGPNASIEVLADGEPVEDGFEGPIRNAHSYEIRYNASADGSGS